MRKLALGDSSLVVAAGMGYSFTQKPPSFVFPTWLFEFPGLVSAFPPPPLLGPSTSQTVQCTAVSMKEDGQMAASVSSRQQGTSVSFWHGHGYQKAWDQVERGRVAQKWP